MTQGGDEQEDTPEEPTDPVDGSREEEEEGQEIGHEAMQARREGVEDVSAVKLAAGNEIERGDEETDPAGDEDGVGRGLVERGNGGVPVGEKVAQQLDGERIAAEANDGLRCAGAVAAR